MKISILWSIEGRFWHWWIQSELRFEDLLEILYRHRNWVSSVQRRFQDHQWRAKGPFRTYMNRFRRNLSLTSIDDFFRRPSAGSVAPPPCPPPLEFSKFQNILCFFPEAPQNTKYLVFFALKSTKNNLLGSEKTKISAPAALCLFSLDY